MKRLVLLACLLSFTVVANEPPKTLSKEQTVLNLMNHPDHKGGVW